MEKEPREGMVDFSLLEAFIRSVEKFLQTVEEPMEMTFGVKLLKPLTGRS
jgi:hypothetical protein